MSRTTLRTGARVVGRLASLPLLRPGPSRSAKLARPIRAKPARRWGPLARCIALCGIAAYGCHRQNAGDEALPRSGAPSAATQPLEPAPRPGEAAGLSEPADAGTVEPVPARRGGEQCGDAVCTESERCCQSGPCTVCSPASAPCAERLCPEALGEDGTPR